MNNFYVIRFGISSALINVQVARFIIVQIGGCFLFVLFWCWWYLTSGLISLQVNLP